MIRFSISFEFELGGASGKRSISYESWRRLQNVVKNRDKVICQHCGHHAPNGHVDHLIPLSRGGTDALDNLVWSCADCNLEKGDQTVDEWQGHKSKALKLEISQRNDNGEITETNSLDVRGISQDQLVQLAKEILNGRNLTSHAWIGPNRPFTRNQFDLLMSKLEQLKYVTRGRGNAPRKLTYLGQSVFRQLAQSDKEDGNL